MISYITRHEELDGRGDVWVWCTKKGPEVFFQDSVEWTGISDEDIRYMTRMAAVFPDVKLQVMLR